MKTELTIPEHFPVLKEEDLKTALKRRDDYARGRDIQAAEFNKAITLRLEKDKKMQESGISEEL